MNMKLQKLDVALALAALSTVNVPLSAFHAHGTAFTYRACLQAGGQPANGLDDFHFELDLL